MAYKLPTRCCLFLQVCGVDVAKAMSYCIQKKVCPQHLQVGNSKAGSSADASTLVVLQMSTATQLRLLYASATYCRISARFAFLQHSRYARYCLDVGSAHCWSTLRHQTPSATLWPACCFDLHCAGCRGKAAWQGLPASLLPSVWQV